MSDRSWCLRRGLQEITKELGLGDWGRRGRGELLFPFLHLLKEDPSTLLELLETKDCQQHCRESTRWWNLTHHLYQSNGSYPVPLAHHVAGTVLSASRTWSCLILSAAPPGWYFLSYFTGKETEGQNSWATCSRPQASIETQIQGEIETQIQVDHQSFALDLDTRPFIILFCGSFEVGGPQPRTLKVRYLSRWLEMVFISLLDFLIGWATVRSGTNRILWVEGKDMVHNR